ncbi:PAS domain S-box protein [bacterium]|nr:PAS domain S-box protein [bacterium]
MINRIRGRLNNRYLQQSLEIQTRVSYLSWILMGSIILCLLSILLAPVLYLENSPVFLSGMIPLLILLVTVLLIIFQGKYHTGIAVFCTGLLCAPFYPFFRTIDSFTLSPALLGFWLLLPLIIHVFFGTRVRGTFFILICAMGWIAVYQTWIWSSSTETISELTLAGLFYLGYTVIFLLHIDSTKRMIRAVKSEADRFHRETAALKKSNDRFQQVSKMGAVAFWEMNPETQQVSVSDWFSERLGYLNSEFPRTVSEIVPLFHGTEIEGIISDLNDVIQEKCPYLDTQHRIKTKSGDWIWVSSQARFFREENLWVGMTTDISDTKNEVLRLAENLDRYRKLYENAPVGLFRTSISDGRVIACNEQMVRLFGYENKQQFLNRVYSTDYYADSETRDILIQKLSLDGQVNNFEARFLRRDGSRFWARYSAKINEQEGFIEGGLTDITTQRQAETALIESERRFQDLVDNLMVGISIVQDGSIIFMNPEQQRLLGIDHEMPKLDDLQIHPDDTKKFAHLCQSVNFYQAIPAEMTIRFYPFDKSREQHHLKYVNIRTKQILYRGSQSVMITMENITRIKKLEELSQIKEKMISLGHASLGIAHEIRSPLSGINLLIDGVKENFENPAYAEEIRDLLNEMKKASNTIGIVVNRALDFARPSVPKSRSAQISEPIREAISLMKTTLRKSEIKLETDLNGTLPSLFIDVPLIEQVLLSLISNAMTALKGEQGPKTIRITAEPVKNEVLIAVEDSGPGVPENLRQNVFEPFFTTDKNGSGIGLSICQRIITNHGGSISVTASSLGGAKFILSLPIDKREIPR